MNGIAHELGEDVSRCKKPSEREIPIPCISFVFQFTFFSSVSGELLRM